MAREMRPIGSDPPWMELNLPRPKMKYRVTFDQKMGFKINDKEMGMGAVIKEMRKGGFAEKSMKMHEGDQLFRIRGIDVRNLPYKRISKMLKDPARPMPIIFWGLGKTKMAEEKERQELEKEKNANDIDQIWKLKQDEKAIRKMSEIRIRRFCQKRGLAWRAWVSAKENAAASMLQRVYRGRQGRNDFLHHLKAKKKKDYQDSVKRRETSLTKEDRAARKIQARYRGRIHRRYMKRMYDLTPVIQKIPELLATIEKKHATVERLTAEVDRRAEAIRECAIEILELRRKNADAERVIEELQLKAEAMTQQRAAQQEQVDFFLSARKNADFTQVEKPLLLKLYKNMRARLFYEKSVGDRTYAKLKRAFNMHGKIRYNVQKAHNLEQAHEAQVKLIQQLQQSKSYRIVKTLEKKIAEKSQFIKKLEDVVEDNLRTKNRIGGLRYSSQEQADKFALMRAIADLEEEHSELLKKVRLQSDRRRSDGLLHPPLPINIKSTEKQQMEKLKKEIEKEKQRISGVDSRMKKKKKNRFGAPRRPLQMLHTYKGSPASNRAKRMTRTIEAATLDATRALEKATLDALDTQARQKDVDSRLDSLEKQLLDNAKKFGEELSSMKIKLMETASSVNEVQIKEVEQAEGGVDGDGDGDGDE